MKGQLINILAVIVVVGVVAGAAWFKSQRSEPPANAVPTASGPAPIAQAPQTTIDETVAKGELCPEPPPTAQPTVADAELSTTASPAETKLPRLVDLGAQSCKACKALAPILDALHEEYKGRLDVEFIDVWKNPAAKKPYNIRVIPTQVLFDKDGKEVWRHEGFISKEDLKKLFAEKVGVE